MFGCLERLVVENATGLCCDAIEALRAAPWMVVGHDAPSMGSSQGQYTQA